MGALFWFPRLTHKKTSTDLQHQPCVFVFFIFLCLRVFGTTYYTFGTRKIKSHTMPQQWNATKMELYHFFPSETKNAVHMKAAFCSETATLDWIGTNSGICHDKNFHARYPDPTPASFCLQVSLFLAHLQRNCNFLKTNKNVFVNRKLPFKSCMATAQKFRKYRYRYKHTESEWERERASEREMRMLQIIAVPRSVNWIYTQCLLHNYFFSATKI